MASQRGLCRKVPLKLGSYFNPSEDGRQYLEIFVVLMPKPLFQGFSPLLQCTVLHPQKGITQPQLLALEKVIGYKAQTDDISV